MDISTDLFLEQIYNFLAEQPEFKSKKPNQQLVDFLDVIHDDPVRGMLFVASDKIIIKFGERKEISVLSAPPFRNKSDFLEWIGKQLRI